MHSLSTNILEHRLNPNDSIQQRTIRHSTVEHSEHRIVTVIISKHICNERLSWPSVFLTLLIFSVVVERKIFSLFYCFFRLQARQLLLVLFSSKVLKTQQCCIVYKKQNEI